MVTKLNLAGVRPLSTSASPVPFLDRVYSVLKLKKASAQNDDFLKAFEEVDTDGNGVLENDEIRAAIEKAVGSKVPNIDDFEKTFMAAFDHDHDGKVSKTEFVDALTRLSEKLDPRIWPIATSTLFVGMSVGVIIPAMPLLVQEMGLSPGQFGLVVASLALTKMLGNVPAAMAVDRFGRKPLMTTGLAVMTLSMVGIGASTCFDHLVASRMLTGLGIAAFTTASTMYMTDISTPLNRARSLAPLGIGFSVGAMMGPALGGLLTHSLGVSHTFWAVAAMFGTLAVGNHLVLTETRPEQVLCPCFCLLAPC